MAHCGRKLELPVTVVVPESTSARAKELIEQEGARLILHGKVWSEANDYTLSLATDDIICVHPFDHPLLWEGISTIVDEVISEGVKTDAVILSIGGGSMLSGIAQGLEKHQLGHIRFTPWKPTARPLFTPRLMPVSWCVLIRSAA